MKTIFKIECTNCSQKATTYFLGKPYCKVHYFKKKINKASRFRSNGFKRDLNGVTSLKYLGK